VVQRLSGAAGGARFTHRLVRATAGMVRGQLSVGSIAGSGRPLPLCAASMPW